MKTLFALILSTVIMFCSGCRTVQSPAGQPTPYQKAVTYNTALSETNKSLAQSVISLNTSNIITVQQAAAILSTQKKIANIDIQVSNILAQGPVLAQANSAQLLGLIGQITSVVQQLEAGNVITNNVNTAQVQAETDAIITIAESLVIELNMAGVK